MFMTLKFQGYTNHVQYRNTLSLYSTEEKGLLCAKCIAVTNSIQLGNFSHKKFQAQNLIFKVILCSSEHICSIVRYCFRSFKQL